MINLKYDLLNNNYNITIINNKYIKYKKDILIKDFIFLNNFFNFLIKKNKFNLIKELIQDITVEKKDVFRYDYNKIKEHNVEIKNKFNIFKSKYKLFDYNQHFKNKDLNNLETTKYKKHYLINLNHNIDYNIDKRFIKFYKNKIEQMLIDYYKIDIIIKKKYFYIKQYEEYLYNLDFIFTI